MLTVAQATAAARVLKALADPVRLRLVSLILAEGQSRVGDLGAEFDLSQPTITHHLNVLFEAGLLVRTREGTGVLYRANVATLAEAAALIRNGETIGFSGFTPAGAAKAIPRAIAARARAEHAAGREFQIGVVTGASTGRAPGVLLDWRTVQGRWEAYVVWADGGGNVKPRAYLEWVRQEHVTRRD